MNLFLKAGWLDCESIIKSGYPFIFIIGARGIGKTYGVLKYILDYDIKHMLLRRTQVESDIISNPEFHPYKKICSDEDIKITTAPVVKNVAGIFRQDADDEIVRPGLGYIAALSTFANIRGFDSSDVNLIYLDEFIPEAGKTPIKMEFEKFLNMYETVNRNRELDGEDPVQAICTANSNTIDNPYFIGLGIVNKIYAMQRKGRNIYTDDKRGLLVISLSGSPISAAKQDTALYRLAAGSGYASMAINNEYAGTDSARISNKERMIEYRPMFTVGEITVYRHKSDLKYYVSTHKQGAGDLYTTSSDDIIRCKNRYSFIVGTAFLEDRVIFEDAISQVLFKKYLLQTV